MASRLSWLIHDEAMYVAAMRVAKLRRASFGCRQGIGLFYGNSRNPGGFDDGQDFGRHVAGAGHFQMDAVPSIITKVHGGPLQFALLVSELSR